MATAIEIRLPPHNDRHLSRLGARSPAAGSAIVARTHPRADPAMASARLEPEDIAARVDGASSTTDQEDHSSASLARGLELLERIVLDDGRTHLSELARQACLPPSTARRLTLALQRAGYVMRVARGRYGIGQRVLGMAKKCTRNELIISRAREPAHCLATKLQLTAHIGIFEDDMVTYVCKEYGGGPELFTREGQQMEAYCTAIGKMLLSTLPDMDREDYLTKNPFVALTSETLTDPDLLRTELDAIRRNDFATENWEIAEGLQCLAMPIRNVGGDIIAAISIARQLPRIAPWTSDQKTLLRHAALEISRRLATVLKEPA